MGGRRVPPHVAPRPRSQAREQLGELADHLTRAAEAELEMCSESDAKRGEGRIERRRGCSTMQKEGVVCEHGTAVGHRKCLPQAEDAGVSERAERATEVRRIQGVRAVLDQDQPVVPAELADRDQVRLRKPEVVRHDHRARPWLDRLPEIVDVDPSRPVDAVEANRRRRPQDGVELCAAVVGRDENDV